MIVVRVEIWPKGDKARAIEFARAYINNQVTTTQTTVGRLGDYKVELHGGVWRAKAGVLPIWKRGFVLGFDRIHRGVWDLLLLALQNTIGNRNA